MSVKVCNVSTVHPRHDSRIFHKQCMSLKKRHFDVLFCVADGKGDSVDEGISIRDIGAYRGRFQRMLKAPVRMFMELLSIKADIFVFHDPELLPLALAMKLVSKARTVYDSHESYRDFILHKEYIKPQYAKLLSKAFGILEDFVVKRLDFVISATKHIDSQFDLGDRTAILYNYPKLSEWDKMPARVQDVARSEIVYIGSIVAERGISYILQAIEPLDCLLNLAGNYEPESYREVLQALPGWSKVKEYGYVDRTKALQIISRSVAGLILLQRLPNNIESLSTKMFEYMAGGIAVIAPDFPIYKAIIERNKCGICVDPANVDQIRAAISYLIANPAEARKMGENGIRLTKEVYNWESQEALLEAIYTKLAKKAKHKHP
jgi:glycosyltransferase involved in cell wall biosynthesis